MFIIFLISSSSSFDHPSSDTLTDKISTYLNKCLESGALQLSHLKKIEERVIEDFNFSSFHEFGHSSFLEFLLSDKKMKQVSENDMHTFF